MQIDTQTEQSLSTWQLMVSDIKAWAKLWDANQNHKPLSFSTGAKLVFNYCGLRASLLYRLSHGLAKREIPVLPGILTRLNISLYGFDIPATVEIGAGFYMPHPVGIVINAQKIGANVTLISAITIGMGRNLEFPIIEDDVFVGTGARILGGITVGKGAKIGANAVVLQDVPAGATAVGVPAIIKLPREQN